MTNLHSNSTLIAKRTVQFAGGPVQITEGREYPVKKIRPDVVDIVNDMKEIATYSTYSPLPTTRAEWEIYFTLKPET